MKKTLLIKYRKELLILMMGTSLVLVLLLNLQKPTTKREMASKKLTSESSSILLAAQTVEDEQFEQSTQLSYFKSSYASFTEAKTSLSTIAMEQSLENLRPQLVLNWFRLKTKIKDEVVSSISFEDSEVKKQVLLLLLSLPTDESQNYRPLVLKHIVDQKVVELIPEAFRLLKKTSTPSNEIQTAKHIVSVLQSGDDALIEIITQEVSNLISPNTYEIFKKALATVPPQTSDQSEFLTSAL